MAQVVGVYHPKVDAITALLRTELICNIRAEKLSGALQGFFSGQCSNYFF